MRNIKCLIVEDEIHSQNLLKSIIDDFCPNIEVVSICNCIKGAIEVLGQQEIDLIFQDIELEDGNAFELLEKINHLDYAIIFTTAYDEYALNAFKFEAIDYLLKPYSPKDVIYAVNKVKKRKYSEDTYGNLLNKLNILENISKDKLPFSNSDGLVMMNISDIVRIEAERSYCYIYEDGHKKMMVSKPMIEIERKLPKEQFFRSHSSHIINIAHFRKFSYEDGGYAILKDGSQIPVSRRKKQEFLDFINK